MMSRKMTTEPTPETKLLLQRERQLIQFHLTELAEKTGVNPSRRKWFVEHFSIDHFGLDDAGQLVPMLNGKPSYEQPSTHIERLKTDRANSWPWETDDGQPISTGKNAPDRRKMNRIQRADYIRERGACCARCHTRQVAGAQH